MVEIAKNWFRDNQTLVMFLGAQLVAAAAACAAILAYSVRLETRVSIMETRGTSHVAERLGRIDERLSVLDQRTTQNSEAIERVVMQYLRDLQQRQRVP